MRPNLPFFLLMKSAAHFSLLPMMKWTFSVKWQLRLELQVPISGHNNKGSSFIKPKWLLLFFSQIKRNDQRREAFFVPNEPRCVFQCMYSMTTLLTKAKASSKGETWSQLVRWHLKEISSSSWSKQSRQPQSVKLDVVWGFLQNWPRRFSALHTTQGSWNIFMPTFVLFFSSLSFLRCFPTLSIVVETATHASLLSRIHKKALPASNIRRNEQKHNTERRSLITSEATM